LRRACRTAEQAVAADEEVGGAEVEHRADEVVEEAAKTGKVIMQRYSDPGIQSVDEKIWGYKECC
jgi:hypothetical protein